MRLKATLAVVALVLSTIAAHAAATITPTQNGVVMVNRGNGFEQITGPTQVGPNDTVMVNNGSANMTFADGSTTSLVPGQVYTVGQVAVPGATTATAAAATGSTWGTTLLVGGVVVAGTVAAVAASKAGKSSSP